MAQITIELTDDEIDFLEAWQRLRDNEPIEAAATNFIRFSILEMRMFNQ